MSYGSEKDYRMSEFDIYNMDKKSILDVLKQTKKEQTVTMLGQINPPGPTGSLFTVTYPSQQTANQQPQRAYSSTYMTHSSFTPIIEDNISVTNFGKLILETAGRSIVIAMKVAMKINGEWKEPVYIYVDTDNEIGKWTSSGGSEIKEDYIWEILRYIGERHQDFSQGSPQTVKELIDITLKRYSK